MWVYFCSHLFSGLKMLCWWRDGFGRANPSGMGIEPVLPSQPSPLPGLCWHSRDQHHLPVLKNTIRNQKQMQVIASALQKIMVAVSHELTLSTSFTRPSFSPTGQMIHLWYTIRSPPYHHKCRRQAGVWSTAKDIFLKQSNNRVYVGKQLSSWLAELNKTAGCKAFCFSDWYSDHFCTFDPLVL